MMMFTAFALDPPPGEAAQRQAFEDWLTRTPAEFRHRNSIVYQGGGWIKIRPIVGPTGWWVVGVKYEELKQRGADEGADFTAKALPLEIPPPLPNPEKWR